MSIEPIYDVILRKGTVIDGTGGAGFGADIAIQGDQFAEIGDLSEAKGRRDIDVTGLVVAPGFIDVHTHDDAVLIGRPAMLPKITQGVTTVIAGNCGLSGAPYTRAGVPHGVLQLIFKSEHFLAPSFDEYCQKVVAASPSVNSAFLTGHTTLRMEVMGSDLKRPATDSEIGRMRDLLTACLEQGSIGLSTGLFYPPARSASAYEVSQICMPIGKFQGVYVTHMRDEADRVLESLTESFKVGRACGVPVIISHHKCMGRKNFGRSSETLALVREAQKRQAVSLDVYPYTAASTVLNDELVDLSSKVMITWSDPHPEFCGRDLDEVAAIWGCTQLETIAKLQPAGALYFLMDEQDVIRILTTHGVMIGSDGLPEDRHPHPRLWGTFPRVLARYVREQSVLTLENAVHRMTGLAATTFGLRDRGHIQVGKFADLCVFDARRIRDTATFEDPTRPAIGIQYVFVNGELALEEGVPTLNRAGRLLRRISG